MWNGKMLTFFIINSELFCTFLSAWNFKKLFKQEFEFYHVQSGELLKCAFIVEINVFMTSLLSVLAYELRHLSEL